MYSFKHATEEQKAIYSKLWELSQGDDTRRTVTNPQDMIHALLIMARNIAIKVDCTRDEFLGVVVSETHEVTPITALGIGKPCLCSPCQNALKKYEAFLAEEPESAPRTVFFATEGNLS